ncbi:hypothetical protein SRHO_G00327390 [Serrasalmus rhombeus]
MIKECLQFLIEPAKNLKIRLKESRRRVQIERREPLTESQLFIMELARELTWICQRSDVLAHIWTGEDIWPPGVCKEFIVETASILEMKCFGLMNEAEMSCFSVWNWICHAAVEVTLDPDTAHPALLVLDDGKRMRCIPEPLDVPRHRQRFDGWICAVGTEGFSCGRRYWEVEVGDRDWRLGVARESALRRGYDSLNTHSGYYTLRLERGTELKALTLPVTPLTLHRCPVAPVVMRLNNVQSATWKMRLHSRSR